MKTRSGCAPLIIVAALLAPTAYVATYAGLSSPRERLVMHSDGICRPGHGTSYRLGGKVAEKAFKPLEWIDRQVRPKFWRG